MDPSPMTARTTSNFRTPGGMRLAYEERGAAGSPPVILAHGGGQTRHTWRSTADMLVDSGFRTIAYDSRGHGESDWDQAGDYSLSAYSADMRALSAELALAPILIGASLGGLTSLAACAFSPQLEARAVILLDVAPQLNPAGIERIRSFMMSHPDGFETVEQAAEAVARYKGARRRASSATGLARNLRQHPDGRFRWHWDPAMLSLNNEMQDSAFAHLSEAVRTISVPLLLIRGASSDVVTDAQVRAFQSLMPHCTVAEVSGAEHMIVGDQNEMANAIIADFLREFA